jgi:hypothetical protein
MSERITSAVRTQDQTIEQAPATPPQGTEQNPEAPPPAAEAAGQARAAAEAAEAAEAAAREEAHATLKAAVRAFAKGERAYRAGLLESGRLCDLYVRQRLALGDERAAAVQALEGQLAAYSSGAVDVNRLIGCHHAWRLLAESQGLDKAAESVPYGHYRDAYARLLVRQAKDSPEESWALLPGMEAECQAVFAAACQAGLSKAAVEEKCQALLRRYADGQAAEAKARQQAADTEAAAKREAELRARQQAEQAEAKAKAAAEAAEQAGSAEQRADLTAAAEQAREELLATQRAQAVALEEAAEAARRKAAADAQAKAAEQAKAKADAKARAKAARAAGRAEGKSAAQTPAPQTAKTAEARQGSNLLAAAKAGTAKDVAEMAAELIAGSDTPDDVLAELLRVLDGHASLSRPSHRAIKAARVALSSRAALAPAAVA